MTTIVGAIGMIAAGIVFTFFSRPLLKNIVLGSVHAPTNIPCHLQLRGCSVHWSALFILGGVLVLFGIV